MISFFVDNKFFISEKNIDDTKKAIQAIAFLMTTESPVRAINTSLGDILRYNNVDDAKKEIAIRIREIEKIIKENYTNIKSVELSSVRYDDVTNQLVITININKKEEMVLSL